MPVDAMEPSPRHQFLWFFGGGALAIVLLKFLLESVLVAPFVACGLVVLYSFGVWDRVDRRPLFDDAGDYAYYLGFLYTLVSMAVSLYQVSGGLGNDPNVIRPVVSGFGVAIASTICGMAARVYLGRGEETDPGRMEASGRLDLAGAGRRLRVELDYTVSEFRDFRTRMRADLEGAVEEAVSGIQRTQERASAAETSLADFGRTVAEAEKVLSERAAQLSRSAASLIEFETAASRLREGVASVADEVDRRGEDIAAGTRNVSDALAAQAERIARVDFRKIFDERIVVPSTGELRAVTEALEQSVRRLREGWDVQSEAVESTGKSADRLVAALARVASGVQDLTDAAGVMSEAAEKIRTLDSRVSRLGAEGQAAVAELLEFQRGVTGSVEALRGVTEQLVAARAELTGVLRDVSVARRPWWRRFRS